MRATVVCENSIYGHIGAAAEHGWSVWIEADGGPFLFDTGQGINLIRNAANLGLDISSISGILLSHHHFDHTGGLLQALQASCGVDQRRVPVYAHPDLFKDSFSRTNGGLRFIGLPHRQTLLEASGADFDLRTGWREIAPGMYFTGEIPRRTEYEHGDQNMLHRDAAGELVVDPVMDDQTVVIDMPEGLVVILGCSHAGLINILTYIVECTGKERFHTVMGGTHLGPVSEEQISSTIKALQQFDIAHLGTSHCTGPKVAARLAAEFGERFFFASVGTVVEVQTEP